MTENIYDNDEMINNFNWNDMDMHYPDEEPPGALINEEEYYDFDENLFVTLDFNSNLIGNFDIKNFIDENIMIEDIKDLYFFNKEFKNDYNSKEFKYANYIREINIMDTVNIYSVELYNDKDSYMNYQIQIPINIEVINNNKDIPEAKLIKMYLEQALNIKVEEVMEIIKSKPALGYLVSPLKVNRPEAWDILIGCSDENNIVGNKVNLDIFKFIKKMSNKPDNITKLENDIERIIKFSDFITGNNIIDVKIPVKYTKYSENGNKSIWDYEYLIPPVQNIDQNNQLKVNKEFIGEEEIPKIEKKLGLFNGYFPSRYELLKMEYYIITTLHRPMINLIRENIENLNLDWEETNLFEIEQIARIQEYSRNTHNIIDYTSSFTEIISFPNIVRSTLLKDPKELKKEDLDTIEDLLYKLIEKINEDIGNIERYGSDDNSFDTLIRSYISILSIYIYLKMKYELSLEEVFLEYNRVSKIREKIRQKLFISNLSLVGNTEQMLKFSKGLPGSSLCGLLAYEFTFNNFKYKEIDGMEVYNDVKMNIKGKLGDSELETLEERTSRIEKSMEDLL